MRARLLGEEPAAAAAVLSVLFPHSWPDVRASARARCTLPLDGRRRSYEFRITEPNAPQCANVKRLSLCSILDSRPETGESSDALSVP